MTTEYTTFLSIIPDREGIIQETNNRLVDIFLNVAANFPDLELKEQLAKSSAKDSTPHRHYIVTSQNKDLIDVFRKQLYDAVNGTGIDLDAIQTEGTLFVDFCAPARKLAA